MKLSCTKYMLFLAVALLLMGVAACTQSKPVVPTATLPVTTPGLPLPGLGTSPATTPVAPAVVTAQPAGTSVAPGAGTSVPAGPGTVVAPGQPTMLPTPTSSVPGQPTQAAPQPQPTQPSAAPTEQTNPPATTGGACTNPYIVQRGEWLYSIARKCGVSAGAILAANPMVNPNTIYPGQSLVMPGGGTTGGGTTGGNTYVVQRGDTLFSIAARFHVTWQALAAANGISNPNYLFAGQVLTIP